MNDDTFDTLSDHDAEQMNAGLRKIAHHVVYYREALIDEGMDELDALVASETLAAYLFSETIQFE